jgi:hypothetical protein
MVTKAFLLRVLVKGLLLFALVCLFFGLLPAMPFGKISAYNGVFPGRPRFPFGETPREAYSFSLFNLNAMFASHEITRLKKADEFRVVILGDSSIWGTLLHPEETLAGQLNARKMHAPDGRVMHFYNLGYPTLSLFKDLIILERAKQYQPDLVIWPVTLEALPVDKQLSVPLVENNPEEALRVLQYTGLDLDGSVLHPQTFWQRTLIGQRKNLADLFRLQWYGVLWAATGIDQVYPTDYPRAQVDLEADSTFHGKQTLAETDLAFQTLDAGAKMLGDVPLLVINEPILISTGKNSEIRYNFYYPRAVYDSYRVWMEERAGNALYTYADAWDLIPVDDFTNSAIHLNADGVFRLSGWIAGELEKIVQK